MSAFTFILVISLTIQCIFANVSAETGKILVGLMHLIVALVRMLCLASSTLVININALSR